MNIYQRGRIYKLVNDENDNVYYGSTTNALRFRLYKHRSHYKRYLKGKKKYISSFEVVKYRNPKVILVELFPCNSVEELLMRERYFIDNFPCINKNCPIRTKEEKNEKHIQQQLKYNEIAKRKIVKCLECDIVMRIDSINPHYKTIKHKKNLNLFYINLLPLL